jgi:hypothetical protein
MKTILQVVFGIALAIVSVLVWHYIGLLPEGPPSWRTATGLLLLLLATQWFSSYAVRQRIVPQALFGTVLFIVVAAPLLYFGAQVFWEREYKEQPGVYPITWRSGAVFIGLLAISQCIVFLIFRIFGHKARRDNGLHGAQ